MHICRFYGIGCILIYWASTQPTRMVPERDFAARSVRFEPPPKNTVFIWYVRGANIRGIDYGTAVLPPFHLYAF